MKNDIIIVKSKEQKVENKYLPEEKIIFRFECQI